MVFFRLIKLKVFFWELVIATHVLTQTIGRCSLWGASSTQKFAEGHRENATSCDPFYGETIHWSRCHLFMDMGARLIILAWLVA